MQPFELDFVRMKATEEKPVGLDPTRDWSVASVPGAPGVRPLGVEESVVALGWGSIVTRRSSPGTRNVSIRVD
ncbi:hypothetical protein BRD15_04625 [Halobacteriales archaeon SW_6_65_15]|nr:MAG: hypothetical protein BRD15_04625 [Halobacteriales archaeon SW_6_65_15]